MLHRALSAFADSLYLVLPRRDQQNGMWDDII